MFKITLLVVCIVVLQNCKAAPSGISIVSTKSPEVVTSTQKTMTTTKLVATTSGKIPVTSTKPLPTKTTSTAKVTTTKPTTPLSPTTWRATSTPYGVTKPSTIAFPLRPKPIAVQTAAAPKPHLSMRYFS